MVVGSVVSSENVEMQISIFLKNKMALLIS